MRNGKYVTCLRGSTRYAAIDNRAIDCLAESVREDSSFDHIPLHSSRRHERAIVLVVDIRELRIRANSACKRDLEETAIASILVAEPFALLIIETVFTTSRIVATSLCVVGVIPSRTHQQTSLSTQ